MRILFKKIIFILVFLSPFVVTAQEKKTQKENEPVSAASKRKKAKQKWKEQRKIDMEQKKAVKEHHKRLQTKEARKRMRQQKKKSEKLKANKREPFFIRWFKYKKI